MANDRITQLPIEVAVEPDNQDARTTQLPVEVAVEPDTQKGRTSQLAVEVAVEAHPPARLTQEPVEVLVTPDDAPVRATQVVAEVLVTPDPPPLNATQLVVEVLVRLTVVTLLVDAATATVEMPDVGIEIESAVLDLTVEPDSTTVTAVDPTLAMSYEVSGTQAVQINDVSLSHTYTTDVATSAVEMPDVGYAELGEENFTVDTAQASVEMPDVELFETPVVIIPAGSMGAEAMPIDLFGLLTLKVNTATLWATMGPVAIKYYSSPKSKLRSIFRPIFPEKKPSFAMVANPTVSLKVQPAAHRIFKVVPAPPFANLSVECVPVLFEERTSALWGELREKSTVEQAREMLAFGVARPRISVKVPRARPGGK